ncbi:MAG: hypothetical protein ACRYGH_25825 [Janthinobacterium lividum]
MVILICWPLFHAAAQATSGPILTTTLDRGDYFFIPQNALADSIDGIVYQDKTLRKVPITNRPIIIYWFSICNDGSYKLTITPEQIFFASGHDNPNPNHLYWVITIDRNRYEAIRRGLAKNPSKNLLDLSKIAQAPGMFKDKSTVSYLDKFRDIGSTPDGWSDAERNSYCEAQIKNKLDAYFNLLNSYILSSQGKLDYPKSNSPKLFSYFEEEIKYWLPMKTKH